MYKTARTNNIIAALILMAMIVDGYTRHQVLWKLIAGIGCVIFLIIYASADSKTDASS